MSGRGRADAHRGDTDTREDSLPTVAIDYGYFGGGEDDGDTPVLFGRDMNHRWYYGIQMPAKGPGAGTTGGWQTRALAERLPRQATHALYSRATASRPLWR